MKAFRKYPLVPDDPSEIILKSKESTFASTTFDDDGIIVTNYRHNNLGHQYNPVDVAQYAMSNYNAYIETHNEQNCNIFYRHCKWLIKNFVDKGKWGVWYYNFDYKAPGVKCLKPWISAMMQGQGISTLTRYHSLTNDQNSMKIARKSLASYSIPITDGGVFRIDEKGLGWYEEYACPNAGTVLNGFIFALIGAKEWHDYTEDYDGLEKFNAGIDVLKQTIESFELKLPLMKWTRYDNKFLIHSGRNYHNLHVRQLKILFDMTDDQFFNIYYQRWKDWQETYSKSFLFRPYQILCRGYTKIISRLLEG